MDFEPGADIGGKYTVEKKLGEGGVAIVYKVTHKRLKIARALKVLKISHPKLQDRLEKEAELQAQMSHPNIVSVLDVIEIDHSPCLILEYIDGMPLDEWLATYTPTLEQSRALFLGVIDALEEAHDRGIIHRDLKPSNILMQRTKKKWVAKICDFGLAKALEENQASMTKSGVTMGTPAYMAPEQIRDSKHVDQRADIFSLGAIFYEVLSGERAFQGKDTLELLNSVANDPHAPLNSLQRQLPANFVQAIDGSLDKNHATRIPDCETLRAVLLGTISWGEELSAPSDKEPTSANELLENLNVQQEQHRPEDLPEFKTTSTILHASPAEERNALPQTPQSNPQQGFSDFENEMKYFETSYVENTAEHQLDFNIRPDQEFPDQETPSPKYSRTRLLVLLLLSILSFGYIKGYIFTDSDLQVLFNSPSSLSMQPERSTDVQKQDNSSEPKQQLPTGGKRK